MDKDTKEMMTVREWAEKAGLKLHNYDGFLDIYSILSGKNSGEFHEHIVSRFRDAGELVCTRKAFIAGIYGCTIYFPDLENSDEMADVIPEFLEPYITWGLVDFTRQLRDSKPKGEQLKSELEKLLELIKNKIAVREKSIKLNCNLEEVEISELNKDYFNRSEMATIKKYNGTVEGLETQLLDEIMQGLEESIQEKRPRMPKTTLNKISMVNKILGYTARQKENPEIDKEFLYMDNSEQDKEPFIMPFNIIDDERIQPMVSVEIEQEGVRMVGEMPSTPEINDYIKRATESNENERTDSILSIEEADSAMEVIDNQVAPEERRSFLTKIKDFAKNILDKINKRNEGR